MKPLGEPCEPPAEGHLGGSAGGGLTDRSGLWCDAEAAQQVGGQHDRAFVGVFDGAEPHATLGENALHVHDQDRRAVPGQAAAARGIGDVARYDVRHGQASILIESPVGDAIAAGLDFMITYMGVQTPSATIARRCADTLGAMPNRGTPRWAIRVPEPLWQEFGEVAKPDRSAVLRAFIRWYLRKAGAELPPRP